MLFPHWLVSLVEAYAEWSLSPSTTAKKLGMDNEEAAEFFADVGKIFDQHNNIKIRINNEVLSLPIMAIPLLADKCYYRSFISDKVSCPAVDHIMTQILKAMSNDDSFKKNIIRTLIKI